MKIVTSQTVTVEREEISAVTCDKCDKTLLVKNDKDVFELLEMYSISFVGGYGSIFGDGRKVECDLCQECLKEMIGDICRMEWID